MFVAVCMNRLLKSMARKGPHANAPLLNASAVPNSTGTAAAVRLKGLARRNHSLKTCRLVGFVIRAIVDRAGSFFNRSVHGFQVSGYSHQVGFAPGASVGSPRGPPTASRRCQEARERRRVALSTNQNLKPRAVVNGVGPPMQRFLSSIASSVSQRRKRRRQTRVGAGVQYHCTKL